MQGRLLQREQPHRVLHDGSATAMPIGPRAARSLRGRAADAQAGGGVHPPPAQPVHVRGSNEVEARTAPTPEPTALETPNRDVSHQRLVEQQRRSAWSPKRRAGAPVFDVCADFPACKLDVLTDQAGMRMHTSASCAASAKVLCRRKHTIYLDTWGAAQTYTSRHAHSKRPTHPSATEGPTTSSNLMRPLAP